MEHKSSSTWSWIWTIPDRALQRAYNTSQEARSVQTDLMRAYTLGTLSNGSEQGIALYLENAFNQWSSKIGWSLLEFKLSSYFLRILDSFGLGENHSEFLQQQAFIDRDRKNKHHQRRLAWVKAAHTDLLNWKSAKWAPLFFREELSLHLNHKVRGPFWPLKNQSSWQPRKAKLRGQAYESVGLVPRSITRTLSRFGTELEKQSTSLVLPEFRLARYQAVASLQYLACLVILPWVTAMLCHWLWIGPLVHHWWNTAQPQVFLSASQEERTLKCLQETEELLWLDTVLGDPPNGLVATTFSSSSADKTNSQLLPFDLATQIHQRTIQLIESYNRDSIQTVLHVCTDGISLITFLCLLTLGKKRLAVLNSWAQELFYSLSDTMKAFFILLCTDLCIGFHSPHGWEVLVTLCLEHLGCSHNKHVISCFVSTFPVILDTVFKYWIFRHLNRISPSIVVSYHAMNE